MDKTVNNNNHKKNNKQTSWLNNKSFSKSPQSSEDTFLTNPTKSQSHINLLSQKEEIICQLKEEIISKDKLIQKLSIQNEKQKANLEQLSKELDKHINALKTPESNNKQSLQTALETQLKIKDKEIKNSLSLIEILKKDNKTLRNKIEETNLIDKQCQLEDLIHFKNTELIKANNEISYLKKLNLFHKQCDSKIKQLEEKLLYEKIENKKLKQMNFNHNSSQTSNHRHNISCEMLNNSINYKINNNIHNVKHKSPSHKKFLPTLITTQKSAPQETTKPQIRLHIRTNDKQVNMLISEEEREVLSKYFANENKYNDFIKKINILENAKFSVENKLKAETKMYQDKITLLLKTIEANETKIKELETRYKISQCQLNDYKNGKKVYQQSLLTLQEKSKTLTSDIELKKEKIKSQEETIETLKHKVTELESKIIDLQKQLSSVEVNESEEYEESESPNQKEIGIQ